jgi:hypothetical protein
VVRNTFLGKEGVLNFNEDLYLGQVVPMVFFKLLPRNVVHNLKVGLFHKVTL